MYSWGPNKVGQLGLGDFEERDVPQRVTGLDDKKVT